MSDPSTWHKLVTIFWIVVRWLDDKFSRDAKRRKEAKNEFEGSLENHDSDGLFSSWRKRK